MYKSYITSLEVVYDFIPGVLACIGICTLYTCIVMQPLLRPMCKGEAHFIGRDCGLTICRAQESCKRM